MSYDTVIVGAGSAGCVLANRLSADGARALLLEAGGRDDRREIWIPAAFSKLFRTDVDWAYETEPQQELAGRRLYWPRGKVLGGSSSINAMIYIRGHRAAFDDWAAAGCAGWAWDEVVPYFKRSEDYRPGESPFHGRGGPLTVSAPRDPNPLSRAFVEAALEIGLAGNDDFNGARQEGVGLYDLTQRRGRRCSSAAAFLRPALTRPNLTVETGARAARVLIEGARAVGVEYRRNGGTRRASAGQVVLCGGAVNTPQLLMLSGIGPASELGRLDIPVVADLPGVGDNLQDHLAVPVLCECRRPVTLGGAETLGQLIRYLLLRRGLLSSNVGEAGGFVRLDRAATQPELQLHFAPGFFLDHGFANPEGHGLTLGPTMVRPSSRGRIRLRSNDPLEPPAIDPRYLSAAADLRVLVEGIRLARRILAADALAEYRGREVLPGESAQTDDELAGFIRSRGETLYHPVGTCKMGTDAMAVVDPELRVRGVDGLRVADASILPTITNGNTNAPTIMIGEKAADLILAG